MEIGLIQIITRVEAVKIQVEMMKAANSARLVNDESPAYGASHFDECASILFNYADMMDTFKNKGNNKQAGEEA